MKRILGCLILLAFFAFLWLITTPEHTIESVGIFTAALCVAFVIAGVIALGIKWIVEN